MTPSSTAAKVVFGVAGLLLIGFDVPAALREPADGFVPAPQAIARIVYVSATDKYGNPVTDLQQADFELKVDGKKSTIVNVRPAEAPMRIALIVSDAGTGGFQLGLATFMQRLLGRAEFSLISVIVQPETVVEYSSEAGVLKAGLLRMGPRGRQRGAQLMETIQAATKHVQRDGTRPVIVVTRVGAEATTSIPGNDVREQLRQSGAILYVVSTVGAERAAPVFSTARHLHGTGSTPGFRGGRRRVQPGAGARRWFEGFGRPSRAGHRNLARSCAGAHGPRAPEPVRDQLHAA